MQKQGKNEIHISRLYGVEGLENNNQPNQKLSGSWIV